MHQGISRRKLVGVAGAVAIFGGAPRLVYAQSADETAALDAIKQYLSGTVDDLAAGVDALSTWTNQYYDLANGVQFDYDALWKANQATLPDQIAEARRIWSDDAHGNYELAEGIIAGVPALAQFDVWIDAGPPASEDAANAYAWTLTLPDGTAMDKPGNLFHTLTEQAIWGTNPEFVGLDVDFDSNGSTDVTEALPDANFLKGSVDALVDAVAQLKQAVAAWLPTLSDLFTALVVMLPTAGGYFEEWRHSAYVVGNTSESGNFVGNSRLLDVLGIYHGLGTVWTAVTPIVTAADTGMGGTITAGITDLIGFVQNLYDQELAGTRFTTEQAEQFGAEVQQRGDTVAGLVTQAAALINVELQDL